MNICQLIFINTPLFHFLSTYFCASSILSLYHVNKQLHQQCNQLKRNKIFTQRINTALKSRGLDPILFNASLKRTNTIISGSFVLQAINNEAWKANDIDLYTTCGDRSNPDTYWCAMDNYLWELIGKDAAKYTTHTPYTEETHDCVNLFETIHSYQSNDDTWIQCIQLVERFKSATEFVSQTFDCDFLKNTFDGETITLHHVQSLQQRASSYHTNRKEGGLCHIERIKKYQQRNFSILNLNINHCRIGGDIRLKEYSLINPVFRLGFLIHNDDVNKAFKTVHHHTTVYYTQYGRETRYHFDIFADDDDDDDYLYISDFLIHIQKQTSLNLNDICTEQFFKWYQYTFIQ